MILGQPLQLWRANLGGVAVDNGCRAGWCAYVKGAAKAHMGLFVTCLAMKCGWNLGVFAPHLLSTLQGVWRRRGLMSSDVATVALQNVSISRKGAMVKSHDVATWVAKLQLLKNRGLTPSQVIATWNQQTTRESQLVGQKNVALMNLLEAPAQVVEMLIAHCSEFSDKSAFAEECFASKQILPGYVPRSGSKSWNKRLTCTQESMVLMMRYVDASHRRKLAGTRAKLSKESMAEASQMAIFALMLDEFCKEQGVAAPNFADRCLGFIIID